MQATIYYPFTSPGRTQQRCAQRDDCTAKNDPSDDVAEGMEFVIQRDEGDEHHTDGHHSCQRGSCGAAAAGTEAYRDHAEQRSGAGEVAGREGVFEEKQGLVLYLRHSCGRPPNHTFERLLHQDANSYPTDHEGSREQ